MYRKNRKDGKRIYPKNPENILMPYVMPKRHEAEVYLNQDIDITEMMEWIDEKNKTTEYKLTFFNVLVGVAAKVVYSRPKLNHFIKNGSFYERNEVSISFVAKDKLSDDAAEKLVVIKIKKDETPLELAERIIKDIHKTRKGENESREFYSKIASIPKFILKIIMKIGFYADKKGFLPYSIMKNDFNFSTILLSNLGSINCKSAYHHLNEYGTNSIVITIGTIREENKRKIVDLGATVDERIADGFYFAKSLKLIEHIASDKTLLEEKIGKTVELPK